jgi:hypothetical protein
MTGLADPVVGPESKPADALGDGRLTGADDNPQTRKRVGDALEEVPSLRAKQTEVH